MKYGCVIDAAYFLAFGDLAREAENAGWDGIFIADAIGIQTKEYPASDWFDPWVVLAVMADRTERIRLGTLITPISRRRPWKLGREVATLDHLSGGRMIFSVGLGAAKDDCGFYAVGEQMDLKGRAELMDEGLEIVAALWNGTPVTRSGKHFKVDGMTLLPRPVQNPRVPIWVVGVWPKEKSMKRAVSWDGVIMQKYASKPWDKDTPGDVVALREYVAANRSNSSPFDIVVQSFGSDLSAKGRAAAREEAAALADSGATWLMEHFLSAEDPKTAAKWIRQGPPR